MKRCITLFYIFLVLLSCEAESGYKGYSKYHEENKNFIYGPKEDLPQSCDPLVKIYWHQYRPFNEYLCWLTGSKDGLAGCATIAMAQLMAYHRRFDNGKKYYFGSLTGYTNQGNNKSEDNARYVAAFIKDITTHKAIKFCIEYASAYIDLNSVPEFLNAVGYKAYMGSYNLDLIKAYIAAGNPVLVFGINEQTEESHMWIIDGYKDYSRDNLLREPMLHVNWGWGLNYQDGSYDNETGWRAAGSIGLIQYYNFKRAMQVIYVSEK